MAISSSEPSSSLISIEALLMDPAQLEQALEAISKGQSIRETARQYHVGRDYLRRRMEGDVTRTEANGMRQSLSPFQEQQLVD